MAELLAYFSSSTLGSGVLGLTDSDIAELRSYFSFLALFVYPTVSAAAIVGILRKVGADDGCLTFLLMPIVIHKIVFGNAWYTLAPIASIILGVILFQLDSPLASLPVWVWHFIFSMSLARAFGKSILFGIFTVFSFNIAWLILAFGGSEYEGHVDLFGFLRR